MPAETGASTKGDKWLESLIGGKLPAADGVMVYYRAVHQRTKQVNRAAVSNDLRRLCKRYVPRLGAYRHAPLRVFGVLASGMTIRVPRLGAPRSSDKRFSR